jgi:hypothetical protein
MTLQLWPSSVRWRSDRFALGDLPSTHRHEPLGVFLVDRQTFGLNVWPVGATEARACGDMQ